jgi:hypothetical protein
LRFQFPTFSIALGGEVKYDHLVVLADDRAPAHQLTPPASVTRSQLAALSERTRESAIVWAMAACLIHNYLASKISAGRQYGTILDGEGAHVTGRTAALALGCVELDLRKPQRWRSRLERLSDAGRRHDWPILARLPDRAPTRVTAEWMDDAGVQNSILPLNEFDAPSVASHPRFFRIASAKPANPLGELQRAAAVIVPCYIQDLCQRNLWMDSIREHPLFNVLTDLDSWFAKIGGNSRAVRAARRVLSIDSAAPWTTFLDVVFRLHAAGELRAIRHGFQPRSWKEPSIVYCDADGQRPAAVWVSPMQVNSILASLDAPPLDLTAIQRSLESENVWLGAAKYGDDDGWAFEESEWDDQVRRWRSRSQPGMRRNHNKPSPAVGANFDQSHPGEG